MRCLVHSVEFTFYFVLGVCHSFIELLLVVERLQSLLIVINSDTNTHTHTHTHTKLAMTTVHSLYCLIAQLTARVISNPETHL